jgi:DNA-binding response OmpR family regulator
MPQPKTVLIVDDDPDIITAIRGTLEAEGHRVICAANGHQGQLIAEQQHPDLIILDMMMPRRGGFPVLESFSRKKDAPPIIMITANEGGRHKAYAEMLGVVDYIRKPFGMERLMEAVDKVFGPPAKGRQRLEGE